MSELSRSARAAAEIARINAFFPIMPLLGNRLAARRPFEGLTIGVSAHLTTLTGALVLELQLGGGRWVVCGASEATTDHDVVALLRDNGLDVYTSGDREDAHQQVLDHEPDLLADVGASLIGTLLKRRPAQARRLRGAVEVTKTGITRLDGVNTPFPLVNINDGVLKPAVENRHGVGEGLWHAVQALTGMHMSGRRVGVIGYGPVGRGVAAYARAMGASVEVVEKDAIRRLVAHYDGYPTPELDVCIERVGVLVTATGGRGVIGVDQLREARDGLVLVNAGHGNDEIDVAGLKADADVMDQVADHVVSVRISDGPSVILLADGHPLNIVTNAGSPEPVLLHFALLGLTLDWLTGTELDAGQAIVPTHIEREAAGLALQALQTAHG
jgi:adenosylhomocysteinase